MDWFDDGRIASISDPAAGTTNFAWDHAGRLQTVTGPTDTRSYTGTWWAA